MKSKLSLIFPGASISENPRTLRRVERSPSSLAARRTSNLYDDGEGQFTALSSVRSLRAIFFLRTKCIGPSLGLWIIAADFTFWSLATDRDDAAEWSAQIVYVPSEVSRWFAACHFVCSKQLSGASATGIRWARIGEARRRNSATKFRSEAAGSPAGPSR